MPDTVIYVVLIYHIIISRYISSLPAARLVLGTTRADHRRIPLRAPFRIWHGGAFTTVPGCSLQPLHCPIHSLTTLLVQHDHQHQHLAPPPIQEGCGRRVITHRAPLATSSDQQQEAGRMGCKSRGRVVAKHSALFNLPARTSPGLGQPWFPQDDIHFLTTSVSLSRL
jgi:hypothetical protein